jgi:acyl carrier protein
LQFPGAVVILLFGLKCAEIFGGGLMPEDLEKNIRDIVAEVLELPPSELSHEDQFDRVLATIESVAMLEILVTVERSYQIQLYEDEIRALKQWRQLVGLVQRKISEKTTSAPERNAG